MARRRILAKLARFLGILSKQHPLVKHSRSSLRCCRLRRDRHDQTSACPNVIVAVTGTFIALAVVLVIQTARHGKFSKTLIKANKAQPPRGRQWCSHEAESRKEPIIVAC